MQSLVTLLNQEGCLTGDDLGRRSDLHYNAALIDIIPEPGDSPNEHALFQ